jgi:predicted membrane protein
MIGRIIRNILVAFVTLIGVSAGAAAVAKRSVVSTGDADSDDIALAAIFDSLDLESHATSFRGGSLLTWFGGGTLDLRGATLDPAGATLTVRAIFGGGLLVVPEDWQVDLRVMSIVGGIGDSREARGREANGPRLIVDGFAIFGGFGISSRPPDTVD